MTARGAARPLPRGVAFRPAGLSDAETISALRRRVWDETYRGVYPDAAIDSFDFAAHVARDRARISDPAYRVYVIEDGPLPVGYLYFEDRGRVRVQSLYLLRGYRGRGIGGAAFGLVADYCREKGYGGFTFSCNAHNRPALGFYEHMGAVETGRDVGHENRQEDQISFRIEV